jgi:D-glycero-D-manno-heptose 1,7-bisphosphate phosphatase
MKNKIKAAFFDRDGTLIEDVEYLSRLDQIKVLPGAIRVCKVCQDLGYKIFVVTNQSGIARGLYDEELVNKTHYVLRDFFLRHGVRLESFYFCPHHPSQASIEKYEKNCDCRKPKIGMFLSAQRDFEIDLNSSLMFGNESCDLQAGDAAGCKSFNIVKLLGLTEARIKRAIGF